MTLFDFVKKGTKKCYFHHFPYENTPLKGKHLIISRNLIKVQYSFHIYLVLYIFLMLIRKINKSYEITKICCKIDYVLFNWSRIRDAWKNWNLKIITRFFNMKITKCFFFFTTLLLVNYSLNKIYNTYIDFIQSSELSAHKASIWTATPPLLSLPRNARRLRQPRLRLRSVPTIKIHATRDKLSLKYCVAP